MPIFFQGSRDTGSLVSMRRRVVLFRERSVRLPVVSDERHVSVSRSSYVLFRLPAVFAVRRFPVSRGSRFLFFNAMAWFSCVNVLESCSFRWVACVNALEMCLFSRERRATSCWVCRKVLSSSPRSWRSFSNSMAVYISC